jgi:tetratricopeptide (TPR) repeat protein
LHNVGINLYFKNGRLPLALPLIKRSLEIRQKAYGYDHPSVADSLSTMAFVYDLHNDRRKAIPLYEQALEIREKLLGPEAPEVLQTLYNLDSAYKLERQYTKAEITSKRRLAALEKTVGTADPEVARALGDYASVLGELGRDEEAKKFRVGHSVFGEREQISGLSWL